MPHVVRCPHCASPFEFPDAPVCLCPGCGQPVSAPPLTPIVAQVAPLPTRRRPPSLGAWFFSGTAVALVLFVWIGLALWMLKGLYADSVRIGDGIYRHSDGTTSTLIGDVAAGFIFSGLCVAAFCGLVVGLPALYFKLRR